MMKPNGSSNASSRPSLLTVALWAGIFMLVYMVWPQRTTVEINLGGQAQQEAALHTSHTSHTVTVPLEHILEHDENDLDGLEHHHFASMDEIEHHDDNHEHQQLAGHSDTGAAGGHEHASGDHMDGLEAHHLDHIENLEHHDDEEGN